MGERVVGPMAISARIGSLGVQPGRGDRLPVPRAAWLSFGIGRARGFVDLNAEREAVAVLAVMAGLGGDEADRAVMVFAIIPARKTLNPVPRLFDRGEAARGPVGPIFSGPEQRLGTGISLLTRGRLKEAVTPSRSIVARMVAPFIGLPLSACRTTGRVTHFPARMVRSSRVAVFFAVSRSWIFQPTIFRLRMSSIR